MTHLLISAKAILAVLFALVPVACVEAPETAQATSTLIGGNGDECPKLGCSSNSPYLGAVSFHELDATGMAANAEGIRIVSFTKEGRSLGLEVEGAALVGNQARGRALRGHALVGAEIGLLGGNGTRYTVRVTGVGRQAYWQGPAGSVETYRLVWRELGSAQHFQPLCGTRFVDGEGHPRLLDGGDAILFAGDRYDAATLSVSASDPVAAGPWFNIACTGNALSKLVLNRHASVSDVSGTTREQRQAMLKMYTSDVCGTGTASTIQGVPMRWVAANGWSSPAGNFPVEEARWDENGAVCLNVHRLHGTADEMDSRIAEACAAAGKPVPPPCESGSGGYLTTFIADPY